jgi:hypothetical protein
MLQTEEGDLLPDNNKKLKSIFVNNKFDFHSLVRNVDDYKTFYYLIDTVNQQNKIDDIQIKESDIFNYVDQKENIFNIHPKDSKDLVKKTFVKNIYILFKVKRMNEHLKKAIFRYCFKKFAEETFARLKFRLKKLKIKVDKNALRYVLLIQKKFRRFLANVRENKKKYFIYEFLQNKMLSKSYFLRFYSLRWRKYCLNEILIDASNTIKRIVMNKLKFLKLKRNLAAGLVLKKIFQSFLYYKVIKKSFKEFVSEVTVSKAEFYLSNFIVRVTFRNIFYYSQVKSFIGNNDKMLLHSDMGHKSLQNRVAKSLKLNIVILILNLGSERNSSKI